MLGVCCAKGQYCPDIYAVWRLNAFYIFIQINKSWWLSPHYLVVYLDSKVTIVILHVNNFKHVPANFIIFNKFGKIILLNLRLQLKFFLTKWRLQAVNILHLLQCYHWPVLCYGHIVNTPCLSVENLDHRQVNISVLTSQKVPVNNCTLKSELHRAMLLQMCWLVVLFFLLEHPCVAASILGGVSREQDKHLRRATSCQVD